MYMGEVLLCCAIFYDRIHFLRLNASAAIPAARQISQGKIPVQPLDRLFRSSVAATGTTGEIHPQISIPSTNSRAGIPMIPRFIIYAISVVRALSLIHI